MTEDEIAALWAQLGDPVKLPLVVAVPGMMTDNPSLIGAATPPTLTVQLDTLSGNHLLLPLTVGAAQRLILALGAQLQLLNYPLEPGSSGPTRAH